MEEGQDSRDELLDEDFIHLSRPILEAWAHFCSSKDTGSLGVMSRVNSGRVRLR